MKPTAFPTPSPTGSPTDSPTDSPTTASPTANPTIAAAPCYSDSSTVDLYDNSTGSYSPILIKNVKVGDYVRCVSWTTNDAKPCLVAAHKEYDLNTMMYQEAVYQLNPERSVKASSDHLVWHVPNTNTGWQYAGNTFSSLPSISDEHIRSMDSLSVGDLLAVYRDGTNDFILQPVLEKRDFIDSGANNPIVEDGLFVVDGIVGADGVHDDTFVLEHQHWAGRMCWVAQWQMDLTQSCFYQEIATSAAGMSCIDGGGTTTVLTHFPRYCFHFVKKEAKRRVDDLNQSTFDSETYRTEIIAALENGWEPQSYNEISDIFAEDRFWSA